MRLWSLKVNDRRNVGGKPLTRCFYMPGIFSSYIRRWNLEGNKIFRIQGHTLHPQRTLRRRPPQNVRPILYDYYYHYSSCNMHANTQTQINTHTQVRANTYFSKSWNACGCLNIKRTFSCAYGSTSSGFIHMSQCNMVLRILLWHWSYLRQYVSAINKQYLRILLLFYYRLNVNLYQT